MDCIVKLLIWFWNTFDQLIVAVIVLYFTIRYDKNKRKKAKREELRNNLIVVCDKLIKYGVHYEYRALYANYLEALLDIKPHDDFFELEQSIFMQNYGITETANHNFYLCKSDLLKFKHELMSIWDIESERNALISNVDIVLLSSNEMYRGIYTSIKWTAETKQQLKDNYRNDVSNIEQKFYERDLAKSLNNILKILSPSILNHLSGKI